MTIDSANNLYIADKVTGVWEFPNQSGTGAQLNTGLSNLATWTIDYDKVNNQLIMSTMSPVVFYRASLPFTTWTAVSTKGVGGVSAPLSSQAAPDEGFAESPAGTIVVGGYWQTAATGGTGMWYSNDAFATTTNATKSGNTDATKGGGAFSLYYDPITSDWWEGTETCGIFRSTNGAASWTSVSPAFTSSNCTGPKFGCGDAFSLTSDSAGNVLAGCNNGIWKASGSAGIYTWTQTQTDPSGQSYVVSMLTDPSGNIYYGHTADASNPSPIYQSTDNGLHWQPFSVGLPTGLATQSLIYNQFDGYVYVLLRNQSTDQGWVYKLQ